jgi:hypothetical protein
VPISGPSPERRRQRVTIRVAARTNIASPQLGPILGNMTEGDSPQGSGNKGGWTDRSGAGSAEYCDPQVAAMLADRQRGDPAPGEARVKADRLTPASPLRVSSICPCPGTHTSAPYRA